MSSSRCTWGRENDTGYGSANGWQLGRVGLNRPAVGRLRPWAVPRRRHVFQPGRRLKLTRTVPCTKERHKDRRVPPPLLNGSTHVAGGSPRGNIGLPGDGDGSPRGRVGSPGGTISLPGNEHGSPRFRIRPPRGATRVVDLPRFGGRFTAWVLNSFLRGLGG